MSTNAYRIAVIPGDGIGNEVMPEAIKVLEAVAGTYDIDFKFDEKDWSCERYHKTGAMMPEDGLESIKEHDSILLGAVGFPGVPDHRVLLDALRPHGVPLCLHASGGESHGGDREASASAQSPSVCASRVPTAVLCRNFCTAACVLTAEQELCIRIPRIPVCMPASRWSTLALFLASRPWCCCDGAVAATELRSSSVMLIVRVASERRDAPNDETTSIHFPPC